MNYQRLIRLPAPDFKRYTGITPDLFGRILEALKKAKLKNGGNKAGAKSKLSLENQLLLLLMYYREYRPFFHIGKDFGGSEATAWRIVTKIEDVLLQHPEFQLPKKEKLDSSSQVSFIIVDSTETPVQRPVNQQNKYYSGKKNDIL